MSHIRGKQIGCAETLQDLRALTILLGIAVGARCQLLPSSDGRRGKVAFVGPVKEIPGVAGVPWVGVQLDEPTGKNDGSVEGTKYFDAGAKKRGVFVRAERIEVGHFPPLGIDEGEDMEEI